MLALLVACDDKITALSTDLRTDGTEPTLSLVQAGSQVPPRFAGEFTNNSKDTLCIGSEINSAVWVELTNSLTGNILLNQSDNEGVQDFSIASSLPQELGRPVQVGVGRSLKFSVASGSLDGGYFANEGYVFVRDYQQRSPLDATAMLIVFDCRFSNQSSALRNKEYEVISSNVVRLVVD